MFDPFGRGVNLKTVDKMEARVLPWVTVQGDATHRLRYPLTRDSLVYDIGGYHGDWCQDIYTLYGCKIKVFEPVNMFVQGLESMFGTNSDITIYPYGLGGKKRYEHIGVDLEASSVFKPGDKTERILLEDVSKIVKDDVISLMKMNIEGGEYELLERLVETGQISQIANIQIQFHDFVPDAESRRQKLQKQLAHTHRLTYCYPFIWENWERYE